MEKFTFDGSNQLFVAKAGVISFNVQIDLYSDWKEEMLLSDNLKFKQALRTVGGDATVGGDSLGATFFLMNGYQIRPQEAHHRLQVDGNLFTDEATHGGNAFTNTLGNFTVVVEQKVSNLIDKVDVQENVWTRDIDNGQTAEVVLRDLLAITKGRVIETNTNVFEYYGQDGSTLLFTLTFANSERTVS